MKNKESIKLPKEKECILKNISGKPKRIIDIGCGTGFFTFCLSKSFPKAQVIGIDGDKQYIAEAKKKYRNKNLKFEHCNIKDIGSKNFDLVIFSEVVEHLPNVGLNLEFINRLTAKKGILFVTTDNALSIKNLVVNVYYSFTKKKPILYLYHHQKRYLWWAHHVHTWALPSLSTMLNLYGYDLQSYWFTNHFPCKALTDKLFDLVGTLIPGFRRKLVLKLCKTGRPTIIENSQD